MNLNKPIEIDTYRTPPRISPRRKINIKQTPPQKLTPRTKGTILPNVSGQKAAQKRKGTNYEAEENIFKDLEGIAQTLLKMEEPRVQAMLKLEADRADRKLAMTKMKLDTQERIAKEKRENDERIAAHNISFQIEIQKLKAHLQSGLGGPSS